MGAKLGGDLRELCQPDGMCQLVIPNRSKRW